MTTGPLGQGLGSAVGMAIAEAHLAARYNRPGHEIVNHFTYVLVSDGDLMEGVTAEACSLAGHLGLGKLIVLYDDNRVCLAGSTALSFTEDIGKRFEAYGWHVQSVQDGCDVHSIDRALNDAKAEKGRPSILCVRTTIGCGAPHKQNTSESHGSPLGMAELQGAKEALGWPLEPSFFVPEDVLRYFRNALTAGPAAQEVWEQAFRRYRKDNPEPAAEFLRRIKGELPKGWESALPDYEKESKDVATRKASEGVMQKLAVVLPELMGGSADLNPSVLTWIKGFGDFQKPDVSPEDIQGAVGGEWDYRGRNIHFGVREHAMAAIAGGMALHGGVIPYTGTFLMFSDYMRPSMRLAALMGLRVIYVFTHDSIGVGEDGPTHQAVEQLASLRAIPGLTVLRPADANETVVAWCVAIETRNGPVALVLTRQNVPTLDRHQFAAAEGLRRGAYILADPPQAEPRLILIATGSEVGLIVAAGQALEAQNIPVRLVSMPSWELFEAQTQEYRDSVLPPTTHARLAVEAGVSQGWHRYVGDRGGVIAVNHFGASAPGPIVLREYGFSVANVCQRALALLEKKGG